MLLNFRGAANGARDCKNGREELRAQQVSC